MNASRRKNSKVLVPPNKRLRLFRAVLLLHALSGLAIVDAQQTTVTLSASANPVVYGQPLTLTAAVVPAASGNVSFCDGMTVLGVGKLTNGRASLTTSLLGAGTRSLRAYSGLTASPALMETVKALPSVGFGSPAQYAGYAFAAADFNADGKADLVLNGGDHVSVLLGNGDGTFQSPKTIPVTGLLIYDAVVGDFNGDGKPDLAVASGGSVSIFLGNGDGTFQTGRTYTAGSAWNVIWLAVADLDGDGNADLVMATTGGFLLFFGNGDGTFRQEQVHAAQGGYASVVVGDFNGDGIPDLAFGGIGNAVAVFLGTGRGNFGAEKGGVTGVLPSSMVVGDFNGDGKDDLAVGGTSGVSVLLSNGDGTFAVYTDTLPSVPSAIPGYPSSAYAYLAVGDFNGDGKPDLAASYGDYLLLLFGNGDGSFLVPASLGPSNTFIGGFPVVADLNGDGRPDIAVGYGIFLGDAGAATTTMVSSSANPAYGGESVVLTATVSPSDATGWVTFHDGTTALGAVVIANGGGSISTAKLSPGSHGLTGTYSGDTYHGGSTSTVLSQMVTTATATTTSLSSSATQVMFGKSVTLSATVSPASAVGNVAFYDGANMLGTEALSAGKAVFTDTMLAAGKHSLHAHYIANNGYEPSTSLSIVVTVAAVLANGVQKGVAYPVGGAGMSLIEGDFNGDGKTDFAVALKGSVSVLLGNGDGTFHAPLNSASGVNSVSGLATGDFNGDGKPDLIVAGDSSVTVLLGNGDGTFRVGESSAINGSYLVVADFNRDGKADFAISTAGGVEFFLGNGDGTFEPSGFLVDNSSSFAVADFNADGIPDFVTDGTKGLTIFLSHGDGSFTAMPSFDAPFQEWSDFGIGKGGVAGFAVGDFNGDGIPDLAIEISYPQGYDSSSSNQLGVLFSRGDGTFSSGVAVATTGSYPLPCCAGSIGFSVGDYNGDGITDIAVNANNTLTVYLGSTSGKLSTGFIPTNFSFGSIVGEFNGDGIPDLAYLNGTNVVVTLGTVLQPSTVTLTSSPNPSSYGQNVTFTATVSPSTASGTVKFSAGGSAPLVNGVATYTTDYLSLGTDYFTATYSGDGDVLPSTSPTLTQNVNPASTSTILTSSSNPATVGQTVALTATVSDPLATGTITFQDGGVTIGTGTLSSGATHLLLSTLSIGAHALTASYPGDSNNGPSTSPVLIQTVNQGISAGIALTSSPNPATRSQSVTLTATASGSGTVTFYDGGTLLGVRTLVGGRAMLTTNQLGLGNRSLHAYYAGDGVYAPGYSLVVTQTVRALASAGFELPIHYSTGSNYEYLVTSAVTADLNGDGKIDLVVCHYGGMYGLLGNGNGTFQPEVLIAPRPNSTCAAAGDFSGNGKLDLAASYNGFSEIDIVPGNGDGTFGAEVIYQGIPSLTALAAGDFNGDGKFDLLAGASGGLFVLSGLGNGSFLPAILSPTTNPVGVLVLGDFNGDGVTDVATASVGILFGKGDGTFSKEVDYSTGATAGRCTGAGFCQVAITSADFNGDGAADLAVANPDGSVSVLLGSGDGTFRPAVRYNLGTAVSSSSNYAGVGIAVGDFNGDGNTDLAVANPQGVAILSGNGDGTFQPPVYCYNSAANSVLVADFNGDGRDDLLILDANASNPGIEILLGAAPAVTVSGVANAASLAPGLPVAPGSLAVVSGTFPSDPSLSVQIGSLNAPVLSASSGAATIQIPWELSGQSQSTLTVTAKGQTSPPQQVNLSAFAPGIYTVNGTGTGQGAIYDSSSRLVDASNPASAGSTLQIYCTGLGAVSNLPATGQPAPSSPLAMTTTTPTVTIGGSNAAVLFSGLVPGLVGVYQVNAIVPSVSPGTAVPVTISSQGVASNAATIAVQ
jgi:uncharacterized protein (TIGR03437 family)